MTVRQSGTVTIGSRKLTAKINPFGAELTSLQDAQGCELMTGADPTFWSGRAPILFPVVGRVTGDAIRVAGTEYPMPKHGFARHSAFEVTAHEKHRAVFRLTDDGETRAAYPFAFTLDIEFAIEGATLSMTATIGNPGAVPLPASFGFHPAFAWPLPYGMPREGHRVMFGSHEATTIAALDADGFITPDRRETPLDGRSLRLRDALFEADALIWDSVASSRVTYGAPGAPTLDIAFPDTPALGIWTKPGAAYVCIEPWHGIADPVGYAGEYRDKPGVFEVAPGGEQECAMQVTLVA